MRRGWLYAALALSLLVIGAFSARLRAARRPAQAVRAGNAVGDATCLSCHQQKAPFERTAHRLTSTAPSRAAILGSFAVPHNLLKTSNPALYYRMDSTTTGFYETAVLGRAPDTTVRSERIAYVTGVRKGQSYLYWHGDELYQLPVSFWGGIGWSNSPSYPDGRPNFEREIPPRCLECHASSFEAIADPHRVNRYRTTGVILGVTCETCHGSGRQHVANVRSPLHGMLPPGIVNPARLPRARRIDGCALCHSGTAPLQTAAFTYAPGQPLRKRFSLYAPPDTGMVDVHGNQVALLERSRCFTASQMTCATCHDVHREQRDLTELSGRCLSCHREQSCGLFPKYGHALAGKCVNCHMPLQTSQIVFSNLEGRRVQETQVRSHLIKVYPALTQLPK